MHPTKASGRLDPFEAAHRPRALFDASMVLLQVIIQVAVGAMTHRLPQLSFDGSGVGVMSIGRNAFRDTLSDRTRGPEERFGRSTATLLTEQDVDQIASVIKGAGQIPPAPFHFSIMPVGRGACPWFPAAAVPRPLARTRREPFDSP